MRARLLLHAAALAVVLATAGVSRVQAYDANDTMQALDDVSTETGISYAWLHRIVKCETGGTFDPNMPGDHGTSFGAAQLHRGGKLDEFYADGWTDPLNPWQAIRFMADEFNAGEAYRWTCR